MCDGHEHVGHLDRDVSRRRVLQGIVGLAALAGLGGRAGSAAAALPPRPPNLANQQAFALAMHLHASASEGAGSVRSQLAQAALNGLDVAWFTDHDWRRHRLLFRQTYSFTAAETQFGGTWNVPKMANTGSLATTSGGVLVSTPVSPNDPAARKGSLRLRATSTGTAAGSVRHRINAEHSSRANFRSRIAGRTVAVDVLASEGGVDAWGEVLFRLSHQPAAGNRPAGVASLLYRLRTDITTRAASSSGLTAIVDVPVTPGTWQTVTLDPTADLTGIWPAADPRDNSMTEIEFHAVSRRGVAAEYFFGYLRFQEQAGYDQLGVDADLFAKYAAAYPHVKALNGTEISLAQHMNQYGGTSQAPFDYGAVDSLRTDLGDLRADISAHVHALGGVVSINHPFKPGDTGGNGTSESIAQNLLGIDAGGADLFEAGYASKHGADLAQHIAVWDTLSRNGLFLTANGASDDHSGQNWAGQANRFYTGAWAGQKEEVDLVEALGAGRCYVGHLTAFGGTIDMSLDGIAPMGAVMIGEPVARTLRLEVTGIPAGGAVQILRGDVDYAGTGTPRPNTAVIGTRTATELAVDPTIPLPAEEHAFVRAQVVTSAGAVVGFGQPIWQLRDEPPRTGVPSRRRVAG